MADIKAFVGHSFTKDDAELVGKFLQHFDRLSKILPSFSWVHAEAAEPKQLSEKVLSLIADRNVFVAICTKKERVAPQEELKAAWYNSEQLTVKKSAVLWKTSDWIIQEIGMATARGLELILLLEEGIRRPGGLQGDVEYIVFERGAPEKCFDKILEMLTALSPRVATASSRSLAPEGATEPEAKKEDSEYGPDWLTPKEDWDREKFEMSLVRAILMEDSESVTKINAAYEAKSKTRSEYNLDEWKAHTEFYKIQYGKGGSFARLKDLSERNANSGVVLEYLARAFVRFGHHREAADEFSRAASKAADQEEKARLIGQAAVQFAKCGDLVESGKVIDELKDKFSKGGLSENCLLRVLADMAEFAQEEDVSIAIFERQLELNPDDHNTRFSLAYRHSQQGNQELALFHYEKIPYQERNAITWNNLGVSYDHFKLPAKSVDAYRMAESEDETLAMSNLANKFLWAGFIKEAQALCDNALKKSEYHKSVLESLSRLKDMPNEEQKKLEEVRLKMTPKISFYRKIGRAIVGHEPTNVEGAWQGPDCLFEVKVTGRSIIFSGRYERDSNGLHSALGFGSRQIHKYNVEIRGNIRGLVVDGTIRRKSENPESAAISLFSMDGEKNKLIMVLNPDARTIDAIEDPYSANPKLYSLKKVPEKPKSQLAEV